MPPPDNEPTAAPRPPANPLLRYAWLYRGYRLRLVVFLLLATLVFLAAAPVPFVVKLVFDTAIGDGRLGLLVGLALVMLALQLISTVMNVVAAWWLLGMTTEVVMRLRQAVFDKLYALSISFHDTNPAADLHDRIVHETERVENLSLNGFATAVPSVIFAAGILGVLVVINWLLFAVTVAFVPLIWAANRASRRGLRSTAVRLHRAIERMSRAALSALRTMRQTRILGAESHARATEDVALEEAATAAHRHGTMRRAHLGANRTVVAVWVVLILAVGGAGVIDGRLTLGELFSFYAGVALLRMPLDQFIAAVPVIIAGRESLARIFELLDVDEPRPYAGERRIEASGHITVEHVTFAYDDGSPVLTDVSLELAPGQVIALMGPNGSGKSTLAQLLLGFYRPAAGHVAIDGVPYRDLDMRHLRRQFGVLTQDPIMVAGTIRDNVTYGRPDVTPAEVARALELAAADELIAELEDGLDTRAWENGPLLSGGQMQRVALARALLGRPRVLMLDEPSTHLDVAGVDGLLTGLRSLADAPAMLLITHEPEVAAMADLILHMENGRVIRAVESPFDRPRRDAAGRDATSA